MGGPLPTAANDTMPDYGAMRRAEARRVFAKQYEPGAGPERLAQLIAQAETDAIHWQALSLLLRALESDPDWRLALLAANVRVVPPESPVTGYVSASIRDGINTGHAEEVLARAVERVKAETGFEIHDPKALLRRLALPEDDMPCPRSVPLE